MNPAQSASRRTRARTHEDLFPLGWRYVTEKTSEGATITRQVPLTPEDVLHPQEDDFIVQTILHETIRVYLKLAMQSYLSDRKDVVVLGDMRIDWGSPYGWVHGPDVAVFDKVKGGWKKNDGTFFLKKTGGRALLTIEVTSPSTRKADLGKKIEEYFLVGVPVYVIIDVAEKKIRLLAYQAGKKEYENLPPDEHGRIWLEAAGLWLGVEGMDVFLEDAKGNRLPEYDELAKKTKMTENKLKKAASRIAELEEELARLRGKE